MKQLEETMLTVGPWLSKIDDSGLIIALFTIDSHPFAVRLHVYLLDMGSEFTQGLAIGYQRPCSVAYNLFTIFEIPWIVEL